jgi:hypothetical protein
MEVLDSACMPAYFGVNSHNLKARKKLSWTSSGRFHIEPGRRLVSTRQAPEPIESQGADVTGDRTEAGGIRKEVERGCEEFEVVEEA